MKRYLGPVITMVAVFALVTALSLVLKAKARAERERDVAVANATAAQEEQVRVEVAGRATILRLQFQVDANSIADIAANEISAALQKMNDSLGVRIAALTGLEVAFKARMVTFDVALVEMANAVTPQGDTVRLAVFVEEGPPVEGEIVVEVPRDPNAAIMLTTVLRPTPWDATIQLGCTEDNVASIALDTPDWVPLTIGLGVVDQDVCLPLPDVSFAADLFSISPSKLVWGGVGAVVALMLTGALGN